MQADTGRAAGEPFPICLPLSLHRDHKASKSQKRAEGKEHLLQMSWIRLHRRGTRTPCQFSPQHKPTALSPSHLPQKPTPPCMGRWFPSGVVLQVKSCSLPRRRFLTVSFIPSPQHGSCTEAAEKRRWEAPQLQREQAIFSRAASQLLGCRQSCARLCCSTAASLHFLTPSKGLDPCP